MPVVIVFIAVVVVLVVLQAGMARKRRREMAGLAARLGLSFSAEKDYQLAARFGFLDRLAKGSRRYAFNVISGNYDGSSVLVFDYHYETRSHNPKGGTQTHHHYFSFFIVMLPAAFPEVTIAREGFLSKIAQAVGYDDIDFESHEFSRHFCVRSADKRFAYDVCNARMIEYLLANRDLNVEIDGGALAIGFASRISAAMVEHNLRRLMELRVLLPDYLFEGR